MKFSFFHFLPYDDVDLSFREKGRNTLWMFHEHRFDPKKCADYYDRYLSELEFADKLGFDGVCVNEHHQTPHSLMPAPNVLAAALTQRTQNAKIAILGRALPLVPNPLSVAEEWAMLDNMSRGRLIVGMVRGIGVEYHSSNINPMESAARYIEAHDLIKKAWTESGPISFYGKHYECRHASLFPHPYQDPHPPIWIPSGGNKSTMEWASAPERKYTFLQFFNSPYEGVKSNLLYYREAAQKHGYEASPDQLGWAVPTYVADTDEKAINEARPHIEALFNDFMAMTKEMLFPPGYVPPEAMVQIMKGDILGGRGGNRTTIEELVDKGIVHIGSVETVKAKIRKARDEIGIGQLLPMLHFGTMSNDMTMLNLERYARKVMEPLKAEFGNDSAVSSPQQVSA